MGYGSYTASDWNKLKASRGLGTGSANQTFVKSEIQDKYNSRFIEMRESFDSEDSPNSTPIIIGFDVTGSMGYLANEIATNSLNETIMQILTKKPVTDPHMMCAAITTPGSPIQVTQFEADIRVVEQLLDFKVGGGNTWGYDNLLWYFAAKHTKIDSFDKRGKKGILIGIGDEKVGAERNILIKEMLKSTFHDEPSVEFITFEQAMQMAAEKYELIHIVVGGDRRFDRKDNLESYSGWAKAMPGRVAKLHENKISCLAEVIISILQLLNGVDRETILSNLDDSCRDIVREAIEDIDFDIDKKKNTKKGSISDFINDIFSTWK